MLTSFVTVKTATKPNFTFQPPTAAFFHLAKPLHMVVFSTLEIVLLGPFRCPSRTSDIKFRNQALFTNAMLLCSLE